MVRTLVVVMSLCIGIVVGCVDSSPTCFQSGTVVAIARTNPTGNCPSDVLAGIALVNQTLTFMKTISCGVDHFSLNTAFTDQVGSGSMCMGSNVFSFQDLGSDGGSGSDVMTITCADGTTCTATFDATFTPQ